ncbi:hypothetical protein [Stenotrophomonas sp.]|uniref:hypothetical protein n=1 Tax=Stenotrophomonas sp. TaxID=69392 RepID=UPI0028999804|nr:hypothetical protein [Stenotrophomonas sp.]
MRSDSDIYVEMASILAGAAPRHAVRMIMRAELVPESNVCKFEYDAVSGDGESTWLVPGAKVNSALMDLVIELREWCVGNAPVGGREPWIACGLTLDIEQQRVSVSFTYE